MADDEQSLLNLLNKIAVEQKYSNCDIKLTPVSSGGANYTSKLYRVKISSEGKDDLELFAKIAILNESARMKMDPYENERFIYCDLMKTYQQLEDKHKLSEQHKLTVAKFYGIQMTFLQEILVLEDLDSKGYGNHNRFQSVDWSYAAAAVTELTKQHALSIALEHYNPDEYKRVKEKFLPFQNIFGEVLKMVFNTAIGTAVNVVREENKKKFKEFLESAKDDGIHELYKPHKLEVLVHGDFRPSNMLHRVLQDGRTEVLPVDYQTVHTASPVADLFYFIFAATDRPFRAQHYERLLEHYHAELGAALSRLGLDVEDKYSKADFKLEVKRKQSCGLLLSVMSLPLITIPEDSAPTIGDNIDAIVRQNTTDLFKDRMNEVVDEFIALGVIGQPADDKKTACCSDCVLF